MTTSPLKALRKRGLNADIHENRIRVWPRYKMRRDDRLFVSAHLSSIVNELMAEETDKATNNYFMWDMPLERQTGPKGIHVEILEEIPNYQVGDLYQFNQRKKATAKER